MAQSFILSILIAVSVVKSYAKDECPPNASYNVCGASGKISCSNLYKDNFIFHCIGGCQCDPGYVFTNDGAACIPRSECKPEDISCYYKQIYSQNGSHLVCGEDSDLSILSPGCYCEEGLYFDRARHQCVTECPEIPVWTYPSLPPENLEDEPEPTPQPESEPELEPQPEPETQPEPEPEPEAESVW